MRGTGGTLDWGKEEPMTLEGGQKICSCVDMRRTPPKGSMNRLTLGEPITPVCAITSARLLLADKSELHQ